MLTLHAFDDDIGYSVTETGRRTRISLAHPFRQLDMRLFCSVIYW